MNDSRTASPPDVDTYLADFPAEQREMLQRVRSAIRSRVADAVEKIRYGMPAIMLGGRYALHFAGWNKRIGLYPVPVLDETLEAELAPFRAAKDSVNFSWSKPAPYDLIEKVTTAVVERRGGGGGGR